MVGEGGDAWEEEGAWLGTPGERALPWGVSGGRVSCWGSWRCWQAEEAGGLQVSWLTSPAVMTGMAPHCLLSSQHPLHAGSLLFHVIPNSDFEHHCV